MTAPETTVRRCHGGNEGARVSDGVEGHTRGRQPSAGMDVVTGGETLHDRARTWP